MPVLRLQHRVRGPVLALLLAIVCAPATSAQAPRTASAPTTQADSARAATDTGVVAVWRQPIVVFRSPMGARSASERAADAVRRIEVLADSNVVDSVSVRRIPEGMLIALGTHALFTITPADVDTPRGETLTQTADSAASRLRIAVRAVREAGSIPHLAWAAAMAVLATLLFLLALRLLRGSRRFVTAKLTAAAGMRFGTIAIGGFTLVSRDGLLVFMRRLFDLTLWSTGLFLGYLWLAFVLTRFWYTRAWGEALGTYLSTTIEHLGLTALSAIPSLFTVVLIVVATRWVTHLVGSFFRGVEAGTVDVPWLDPETAKPTKRIVVALLWLFAIVIAYPYIPGGSSDAFKGVSVFAGVVLSLGSSGIVNQAMSGMVLMYARALKTGDYVRIGETEGVVTALGMLSTKIRTVKCEEVTLPNAVVVSANVKNFTRLSADAAGVLLHTSVTVGYDTSWRQVEALLLDAARRTDGLRADASPFVLKTALGNFTVEYQLNAALAQPEQRVLVLDRLHGHILDCFNEHGVQIMTPNYEADPEQPKVVSRDRWFAPPASDGGVRAGGEGVGREPDLGHSPSLNA